MKYIYPLLFTLGVALILSSSACAPTANTAYSGFLNDYDRLQPNSRFPGSSDWIDQSASLKKYNAIIIDPVTIRLSSDLVKDGAEPDPRLLNDLLEYMHKALEREFSKQIKIVKRAGKNVLHYRAAITGITTEGGITSSAINAMPIVLAVRTASGMNSINAHIFMEAEYSDSLTGTPVAMVMQAGEGDTVSMMGAGDTTITLKHLQGVVDNWAQKAAQILGETLK